jgi:type II secretory pathway component GspD/PulD (secretin)
VYYLRYTTAEAAAGVLAGFYGGNTAGGNRGGGRGRGGNIMEQVTNQLVEQLAGSATNAIGGLITSATGFSSASVDIVPLVDHNAVLVRAKQEDLATIEQILEVVDQRSGPIEDESDPEPRRIQVVNMAAADMATIVQSVFADRIANAGGTGGTMSNEQIMRLFGGGATQQEPQKMTVTVDSRNNQLIVRAPEALFEKVERLVAELDQESLDSTEQTVVLPIISAAIPTLRSAFDGLGSNAQQQTVNNNTRGGQGQRGGLNAQQQQFQQLQQLQQLFGRGRGGGRGQGGGGQGVGGGQGGQRGGAALGGAGGGRGRGGGRGGGGRGGG